MIRGWLSREGRPRTPVQRVPVPPLDVRPVATSAPEMPPRPQLRRPDPYLPPVTGGQPFATCGGLDERFDPCGAPAIAAGKSRRRT